MGRDREIQAIVEVGRRTRTQLPRWLWIAATLVGVTCATAFAVAMLDHREPPSGAPTHSPDGPPRDLIRPRPEPRQGLATALVIGAGAAVAIGFSIARQRRSHSSRNSP